MRLPLKMEYHLLSDIFQVNTLAWLHSVKIACITLASISPQQIKITKFGPSVLNKVILTNYQISCLHEIRAYYSVK